MPTANSDGVVNEPALRPKFRGELKDVRKLVINYSVDNPGDFHVMKNVVKIVAAIDALEKALESLAYYIRHEDTRADVREREEEDRQRERDRELEIQHARNSY